MPQSNDKPRPVEQPAVRTTIVGGRPPGSGQGIGEIPRGIEVLVKKAAVDSEFKNHLLSRRADAAKEIGLPLSEAERMMLAAVPREQLEAIIGSTTVSPLHRAAFLGSAAALMLAALGVVSCGDRMAPGGSRPVQPTPPDKGTQADTKDTATPADIKTTATSPSDNIVKGIRPDVPQGLDETTRGIRPDQPRPDTFTKGIRPDDPRDE
jgi:hypothetical protein